jgi:glutamate carboxypeptidase
VVTADLLQYFRGELNPMLRELQELVETESPSRDMVAMSTCAVLLAGMGTRLLGATPERVVVDGRVHLRWSTGTPRVAVLCHFDTVWPVGTIRRMPFRVKGGRAYGPGVLDMKASLVQAFHALGQLPSLDGIELLVTSDEEIGSPTSRPMIEALARRVEAVLVIEPSHGGALKTGRKGVGMYRLLVEGRAAHAGFPHEGANATLELGHQVVAIAALAREDIGTTVTPTVAEAGTTNNVVPSAARVDIDVRAPNAVEQDRVDAALRGLTPVIEGTRLELLGGPNRPPLEPSSTAALFAVAVRVARQLGLGELEGASVGGASDGNFAAAVGAQTLDGLGPVGNGAHADHEHIVVATLPERTALLAALLRELLQMT